MKKYEPLKMDLGLELRMFGIVPYNLSPIQQGIQFSHALAEYVGKYPKFSVVTGDTEFDSNSDYLSSLTKTWLENHKTVVLLNGGTTNKKKASLGTLNSHLERIQRLNIPHATFYEPDLGDQLTCVCFIADERVFSSTYGKIVPYAPEVDRWLWPDDYQKYVDYRDYVEYVGGHDMYNIRDLVRSLKKA
jgi:hypothetical protein